jgi:hypothetical protein
MVPEEGIDPSRPYGQGILSRQKGYPLTPALTTFTRLNI